MQKILLPFCLPLLSSALWGAPLSVSGVYPHLRTTNHEGECGTGAVVEWAERLWVISYGPHKPLGSSDKLYEITPDLEQIVRPESVGGTPANRFIHRQSNQLLIGPYLIDASRGVRVIPPQKMFGRLTGTAAHLSDPNKVYYATMEEGLYEVDVRSLEVRCLIQDGNLAESYRGKVEPYHFAGQRSSLPGYHGKGLYTGQGRVVYSNNGDRDSRVTTDPTVPSGALGFWNGSGEWRLIRRNQFTEVSGPGGISGAVHPETDPVWAVGWDAKSLLLALLDQGTWHFFRMPKGSHSYDGAHGWNTEWPRIREIGGTDLLMTMHGTFWKFPKTFSLKNSAGIAPLSNYLRVVGDFTQWQGRVVFGCDDSAKNEFLNKRAFKNEYATPPQSNSNLWFVEPARLSALGPCIGRGSVWLRENVPGNTASDAFLTNGFERGVLHLHHESKQGVVFRVEADVRGTGEWSLLGTERVEPGTAAAFVIRSDPMPAWVRVCAESAAAKATAHFHLARIDQRPAANHADFEGMHPWSDTARPESRAVLLSLGPDHIGMLSRSGAVHAIDTALRFEKRTDSRTLDALQKAAPTLVTSVQEDEASLILEEDGRRYRIPRGAPHLPAQTGGRVCREVATERDLLNVGGTFFELPARNAQGLAKVRPIATHLLDIDDFASQYGLMFLAGKPAAEAARKSNTAHVFSAADSSETVWAGVIDDLWKLGKARGVGGPWKNTRVEANTPSDPYLMTAYDKKTLRLSHNSSGTVHIVAEVDVDGTGVWIPYRTFAVDPAGVGYVFPEAFGAYWIRFLADQGTVATAQLAYE